MKMTVQRGATINLGSYESSRIDIAVECDIGEEDRNYALEQLDTFVRAALNARITEVTRAAGLAPHPATRFTGRA